ncbi:NAD-binding protein [Cyanobacterium aponinum UTEX 3221]|uniref:TrkA-N domain protein n=1 Tax=Cyanobacterium aponinum (strain PCC 10605) TaxID=755178 RepID=K9Z1K9_CYAAP|nr:NAD-binding protein [Cyanobacterium aponinum]AFZ52233.1 TrkA-N domain protein [Cyanobacterium aponinum PCC 10605]MBD2393039.1 NAD-binding protein [Cyanobacterium aponinum FACHB-4101]WRL39557.1 NAD-binding protein [Cyanobacterium aponinum UTEX 3221]
MKPLIIVSGLGRTGYKIYQLLKQQGAEVVGLSDRTLVVQEDDRIIVGDLCSPQVLIEAGIKEATTIVLASNDDALNIAILTQAKTLNPKIRIVNRLYNQTLGQRLDYTVTDHLTMSVARLAAPIFAFSALGSKTIGHLRLFEQTWSLHEEIIDSNHPWYGVSLSHLWENLEQMLIYYLPKIGEMDLVTGVKTEQKLQVGDHLIVAHKTKFKRKSRFLWKQWFKFFFNLSTYKQYVRPVIMVTLILIILIALASIIYLMVNWNISPVDALYFSVGMITGAGGKEEVAESAPDGIKIFTAVMMIIGAGIVGIFYALLNDFVLGSRFKQFLDAARVATVNHYVVCGLGNVGMEVIRELKQQGHDIVVIESDHSNRFLHSVRSLGIPIILEDATLAETLQSAHIEGANGIIVVTSNDMVNVEIALTAKALMPKLPVVLRIQDNQFTESVQDVFQFENVFSPSELATYSFAAAALGGRILGNGMTDDLLWVAIATLITPNHPFCGKIVENIAPDGDFVPLYIAREDKNIHGWNLLTTELKNQDVLYLTVPATKLKQLWQSNSNQILQIIY